MKKKHISSKESQHKTHQRKFNLIGIRRFSFHVVRCPKNESKFESFGCSSLLRAKITSKWTNSETSEKLHLGASQQKHRNHQRLKRKILRCWMSVRRHGGSSAKLIETPLLVYVLASVEKIVNKDSSAVKFL